MKMRKYGAAKIDKIGPKWRVSIWRKNHWMTLSYEFGTRREARELEKSSR